tara:strand:- start:1115 stop:2080 length:966 start_codon:yes stop_codon:yes gene_type:complete
MIELILLILGLVGLFIGSGIIVDSSKRIAHKLKISQTLIGLTIVSIGTSIPEIMTNLFSGYKVSQGIQASGIAIGTNLGSDITQITLVLGLTALLGTMYATKDTLKRDGKMILFSIIAVFIVGYTDNKITIIEAIGLLILYILYLYRVAKNEKFLKAAANHKKHSPIGKESLKFIGGLAVLLIASKYVVESALSLSTQWGVAQSFIGIMIVGVGTALPELSTAIRAITKKAGDLSIGTLLGSNITDPMLSLPLGAIAAGTVGLTFDRNLLFFDIPFWFIASIIALYLLKRNMKIGVDDKKEGFILVGLYLIFITVKIVYFR